MSSQLPSNQCVLLDGVIYCQCGDQSSHYGTMGERGAREVRCEPPPKNREQRPSKQKVAQETIDRVCAGGGSESERDGVWNYIRGLQRDLEDAQAERNEAAATVATWMESCTGKHGSQQLCVTGCTAQPPSDAQQLYKYIGDCLQSDMTPEQWKVFRQFRRFFPQPEPTGPNEVATPPTKGASDAG